MRKILSAITLLLIVSISILQISFSSESPVGKTGAPGEGLCTDCHNTNAANSGIGEININFDGKPGYKPNEVYKIWLKVAHPETDIFGFSLVALDSNNNSAGTLAVIENERTKLTSNGNVTYIGHKDSKEPNNLREEESVWEIEWTSPDTTTGAINFYFVGRAVDKENILITDFVYNDSLKVSPGYFTGISEIKPASFTVYPNPVILGNTITINSLTEKQVIVIYNQKGKLIEVTRQVKYNTQNLTTGIYFLVDSKGKANKLMVY